MNPKLCEGSEFQKAAEIVDDVAGKSEFMGWNTLGIQSTGGKGKQQENDFRLACTLWGDQVFLLRIHWLHRRCVSGSIHWPEIPSRRLRTSGKRKIWP